MSITIDQPATHPYRTGKLLLAQDYTNVYVSDATATEHEYVILLNSDGIQEKTVSNDGKIYANHYFKSTDPQAPTISGVEEAPTVQYHGHRFIGELIAVDALNALSNTTLTSVTVSGVATFDDNLTVATTALVVKGPMGFIGINKAEPTVALDIVGAAEITLSLTVAEDITITSGDMFITAGDITATAGALNFDSSAGDINMNGGDINMTGGNCFLDTSSMNLGTLNASSATGQNCAVSYLSNTSETARTRATNATDGSIYVEDLINLVFDLQDRLDALDVSGSSALATRITEVENQLSALTTSESDP